LIIKILCSLLTIIIIVCTPLYRTVTVYFPHAEASVIPAVEDPKFVIDEVFGVDSVMHKIAMAESHYEQFNASGTVLIGTITPDRGLYQISPKYWGKKAIELGYDIDTTIGNCLMAKYILKVQGLSAWSASKTAWSSL